MFRTFAKLGGFSKAALDIGLAFAAWPNWKLSLLFGAYAIADVAATLLL